MDTTIAGITAVTIAGTTSITPITGRTQQWYITTYRTTTIQTPTQGLTLVRKVTGQVRGVRQR